jgi:hypothetical protein
MDPVVFIHPGWNCKKQPKVCAATYRRPRYNVDCSDIRKTVQEEPVHITVPFKTTWKSGIRRSGVVQKISDVLLLTDCISLSTV